MRVIQTVTETDQEGLVLLQGQRVTFMCGNYTWCGDLVGVNDVQVKIENAAIVYETGPWSAKAWKDAQSVAGAVYIRLAFVESYFATPGK